MSQGPLCPNLTKKVQKEVSQMANRKLSCAMLYRWFKCKLKPPNNPLLSAHALSKRRPSGRSNNGQRCGKCGKSHERGNCPAYGKTCDRCKGINHFKAVCHSKVTAKTAQSPHRSKKSQPPRRGSTGSYNGQGKGGGNRQHQKKKTPKKPPKQNAYAVTIKNSVPSEVTTISGGEREKQGNV